MACRSLHEYESDLALAGGASALLEPRKSASGSVQGMLSPTGRCRAFDVAADGFVSSEGCVVMLLKRLADALADDDRILAVVRGTAANQDGRTVNIATPSLNAQVAVYRKALTAAGVDASTVGMVEAHGPGTPVGDPIEYASLAQVYGTDGPCALASEGKLAKRGMQQGRAARPWRCATTVMTASASPTRCRPRWRQPTRSRHRCCATACRLEAITTARGTGATVLVCGLRGY